MIAGSSSHSLIPAHAPIPSSLLASQTAPLNVLPTTSTQRISATSTINTPSINASRATVSHLTSVESSVSRGKD